MFVCLCVYIYECICAPICDAVLTVIGIGAERQGQRETGAERQMGKGGGGNHDPFPTTPAVSDILSLPSSSDLQCSLIGSSSIPTSTDAIFYLMKMSCQERDRAIARAKNKQTNPWSAFSFPDLRLKFFLPPCSFCFGRASCLSALAVLVTRKASSNACETFLDEKETGRRSAPEWKESAIRLSA